MGPRPFAHRAWQGNARLSDSVGPPFVNALTQFGALVCAGLPPLASPGDPAARTNLTSRVRGDPPTEKDVRNAIERVTVGATLAATPRHWSGAAW